MRILFVVVILAAAIGGAIGLSKLKPPPEKKDTEEVAALVDVVPLEATSASFSVASQGNVRPGIQTTLSAELSGTIISMSPKFVAGGVFAKGEALLRIDPINYQVAVDQAEALLKQREIEHDGAVSLRAKGYRAEAEVASAAAALASAHAGVVRANHDLERTTIRLPYAGMVKSKDADLGQYVTPGTRLGVTFTTEYAEVRLPLTDQDLAFMELPDPTVDEPGPAVALTAIHNGRLQSWQARIVRTEGVVDEQTRMTFAVARIDDPYRLGDSDAGGTPLPVGKFVSARIAGSSFDNVIRVPLAALRGRNQLLFIDDADRLRIREVEVLRTDAEYAYVADGASVGERIAMTTIESPINGMQVRTRDIELASGADRYEQSN